VNRLSSLLIALAALLSVLAAGLRPDAFFVGDPGVKLIAAQNAIDHPSRPFEITLPSIASIPVPHVEPFFSVHGDHAHAITSALFPVLSAPFLAAFGVRGLYVLPALGFLLTVAGCAALATALDSRRRPVVVGLAAALGTPFLFYGLEFWEHTLALGCAAMGAALFLQRRALLAGLLFGVATMLRPEAGWFAGAFVAASRALPDPPSFRSWLLAAIAAVVALAPLQLYTIVHFGTLFPPHLNANAAQLGDGWAASRVALAGLWLGRSDASFWRVAPVVICALASLGLAVERQGRRFLWLVAGATALLVFLSAPNDGGGQWGPRYLLFVYIPLAVLAADAFEALPKGVPAVAATAVAVVAALLIQRTGYRQLQGTKTTYGRIVDFVATTAPPDTYVVSDVWWLDQIAASVASNRHFLYVPDEAEGAGAVKRLSNVNVPMIVVIRSASESSNTGNWIGDSCYHEMQRDKISLRDLVAIQLRHRCVY